MSRISIRSTFLFIFIFGVVSLAVAAYLQFVKHLAPCNLCIIQRVNMLLLTLICFIAVLHKTRRLTTILYSLLLIIVSVWSIIVGARHVWLQHLPPDQVPGCGPDLSYMLENFPISETIRQLFAGSGHCSAVQGVFMGLSLASWTLSAFVVLFLISLLQLIRGIHFK